MVLWEKGVRSIRDLQFHINHDVVIAESATGVCSGIRSELN